jgi:hypothetical protein
VNLPMTTLAILAMDDRAIARFWRHVNRSEGDLACWPWLSAHDKQGRAKFNADGRNTAVFASRVSYMLHYGCLPIRDLVCHRCDNMSCVNPGHLFVDNDYGNALDKVAKGRHLRGSDFPQSKLTEQIVVRCREAYSNGEKLASMARRYGVDPAAMSKAVRGITWKHV